MNLHIWLVLSLALHHALGATYPISLRGGGDEASFEPSLTDAAANVDPKRYDAVVVGGGLGGLTAALYLSDAGYSVLLLEKEKELGGLAAGGTRRGIRYARGAAYFAKAYREEFEILKRAGIPDQTPLQIPEPSDSYFWNGELYEGIWEEETLRKLPASFELFKHELALADEEGFILGQPMEEADEFALDQVDAATWTREMPARTAARHDGKSKAIYARFLSDTGLDRADPMKDVLGLMDLYSRSALGANTDRISAVAFSNFYISEIEPRFTTETGTGDVAAGLVRKLQERSHLVTLRVRSNVITVEPGRRGINVQYVHDGKRWVAQGRYGVFAAPLKLLLKSVPGFRRRFPERAKLLENLRYAHYSVHNIFVKGHPYRASYDTWTRANDATEMDFADVILGRWMDPIIHGYEKWRDFKTDPEDDRGVMTLYQPLPLDRVGKGFSDKEAMQLAEQSVDRFQEIYGGFLKERYGTTIEIEAVETNRWPFSIHVAAPGFFSKTAKKLRHPIGRLFFANNNLGTPAFEEALFRGHCAANNILRRLDATFVAESWTECPRE